MLFDLRIRGAVHAWASPVVDRRHACGHHARFGVGHAAAWSCVGLAPGNQRPRATGNPAGRRRLGRRIGLRPVEARFPPAAAAGLFRTFAAENYSFPSGHAFVRRFSMGCWPESFWNRPAAGGWIARGADDRLFARLSGLSLPHRRARRMGLRGDMAGAKPASKPCRPNPKTAPLAVSETRPTRPPRDRRGTPLPRHGQ